MGLTDKEYTIEEKSLGLDSVYDTDKMIDKYFHEKNKEKKPKKITPPSKTQHIGGKISTKILKVSTFGFKNGELQHNMPCPVCLENRAVFTSDGNTNFFAPCMSCQNDGYITKNVNLEPKEEKKGWFN